MTCPNPVRRALALVGAALLAFSLVAIGASPAEGQMTVTNAQQLREAVDLDAATIVLGADITLNCTDGDGTLEIDSATTIRSSSSALRKLSVVGECRIIDVTADVSLTIERLHLSGGHAPDGEDGGAIRSLGSVTVVDSRFTDNVAGDGGNGAPGSEGDAVNVDGLAGGQGGNGGNGGAIHADRSVTVTNSTFSGNKAGDGGAGGNGGDGGQGGQGGHGGNGGAIHADGSVTVTNSTFSGNKAGNGGAGGNGGDGYEGADGDPGQDGGDGGQGGQGGHGGNGGAIHADGSVTITNSTFSGNKAGDGGAGGNGGNGYEGADGDPGQDGGDGGQGGQGGHGGNGGAISAGGTVTSAGGTVTIVRSTLTANTSGGGRKGGDGGDGGAGAEVEPVPGGVGGTAGSGGAIAARSVTLTSSTIDSNTLGQPGLGGNEGNSEGTAADGEPGTGGAVSTTDDIEAISSTITRNSATEANAARSLSAGGDITLDHAAVAGTGPGEDCDAVNVEATNSIDGDGSCGDATTPAETDLGLAALANNDGLTQTRMPAANSPLVNTGAATCPDDTDQRGVVRKQGTTCDIGAVERRAALDATVTYAPTDGEDRVATVGEEITVVFTLTFSGDGIISADDLEVSPINECPNPVIGGDTAPWTGGEKITYTCVVSSDEVDSYFLAFRAVFPNGEMLDDASESVFVQFLQATTTSTTTTTIVTTTPTSVPVVGSDTGSSGGGALPRTGLSILLTLTAGTALVFGGSSMSKVAKARAEKSPRWNVKYGVPYPVGTHKQRTRDDI